MYVAFVFAYLGLNGERGKFVTLSHTAIHFVLLLLLSYTMLTTNLYLHHNRKAGILGIMDNLRSESRECGVRAS